MRDIIGAASAATLGFIHGDLKGAKLAYNLYKKYSNSMPPQRERFYPVTPIRSSPYPARRSSTSSRYSNIFAPMSVGSSRRPSTLSVRSSASSRHHRRGGSAKTGERHVLVKRKHKKGMQPKRTKKIKVSRKFAKKVNQVINKSQTHSGYLLEFGGNPLPQIPANKQLVANFGTSADGTLGILFSPTQVLNVASVLWNTKAYSAAPAYTDAGMFPLNAKIKVKNLRSIFKLVNLGQRTYSIQVILCKPKSRTVVGSPITDWTNALAADNTGAKSINVNNTLSTQLYTHPTMTKTFNANWKTETTKVLLEPGQTYDYHVQGPKLHTYDYQKFVNPAAGGFTTNDPKTTRYVMFVVNGDILGMGSTSGVYTAVPGTTDLSSSVNATSSKGYQMHVEYRNYYDILCPDEAGWLSGGVAPAAGAVPLFERRDAYAVYNNYGTIGGSDTTARIDEENPAAAEGGGQNILA